MAVVELVGGDGYVRFRERERQRRGRAREWERWTGVARGVARRVEEEAASRRWPARARARRAHALLPTGRRLKTVAAVVVGWADFAQLGCYSGGPASLVGYTGEGRLALSVFLFLLLFSIFIPLF